MGNILLQLAEAMRMASELPIVSAIPLYGIAYCGFAYVLIVVLARLYQLINKKVDFMMQDDCKYNFWFKLFRASFWLALFTGCLWFAVYTGREIVNIVF